MDEKVEYYYGIIEDRLYRQCSNLSTDYWPKTIKSCLKRIIKLNRDYLLTDSYISYIIIPATCDNVVRHLVKLGDSDENVFYKAVFDYFYEVYTTSCNKCFNSKTDFAKCGYRYCRELDEKLQKIMYRIYFVMRKVHRMLILEDIDTFENLDLIRDVLLCLISKKYIDKDVLSFPKISDQISNNLLYVLDDLKVNGIDRISIFDDLVISIDRILNIIESKRQIV